MTQLPAFADPLMIVANCMYIHSYNGACFQTMEAPAHAALGQCPVTLDCDSDALCSFTFYV